MAKQPARRFKLVFRQSSTLLKCVVLAAIVLSIAALISLRAALLEVKNQNEALRQQMIQLEAENKELQQVIDAAGSEEGIKKVATDELGLVDPDVQFFTPAD